MIVKQYIREFVQACREEAMVLTRRLISWLKSDFSDIRIVALTAFLAPKLLELL